MMKHYESVVIINAALDDEHINSTVESFSSIIKDNGGEILNLDLWGRKRLAYPIKKSKSGYYAIYRFTSNPETIAKLERMYRLDENVIRYLTIVLDKKALEHYEKLKEQKNEENTVVVNTTETSAEKTKEQETKETETN